MHRLIAFHENHQPGRQFMLSDDRTYSLGRLPENDIPTDWDHKISRRHAVLTTSGKGVHLQLVRDAANPIFVDGRKVDECVVTSGQSFVIGKTRFELQHVTQSDSPRNNTVQQLPIDRKQLQQLRYEDADKRIEVLTSLPAVIRESGVERDLFVRLANLLLAGIQHAEGIAIVSLSEKTRRPVTLHQERRFEADGSLQPSVRLVRNTFEQNKSILHVWDDSENADPHYTQHAGFSWAFCTPMSDMTAAGIGKSPTMREISQQRGIYVTGRSPGEGAKANQNRLHADIKFTEFIADIVGSLQRQRELERQQSGLRQFFFAPDSGSSRQRSGHVTPGTS